jgi:hypothetical protein
VSSRRFFQISPSTIFVAVLLASLQASALTNASLKGGYSFLINLRTANQSTNQFAMEGVLTFDGVSSVSGSFTAISANISSSGSLGGTYAVKSNGTGTLTFSTGSTAQYAITLNSTSGGIAHGFQMLQTNDSNNEIVSGTGVLQSTSTQTYSAASLKGNYALLYAPWTALTTLAEDGGVAILNFDGIGTVKVTETIVFDGMPQTGIGTFTYTVNADGTGTMTPVTKGPQFAFTLNTVSAAGLASGYQFLDTNTSDGSGNLVITGNASKQ